MSCYIWQLISMSTHNSDTLPVFSWELCKSSVKCSDDERGLREGPVDRLNVLRVLTCTEDSKKEWHVRTAGSIPCKSPLGSLQFSSVKPKQPQECSEAYVWLTQLFFRVKYTAIYENMKVITSCECDVVSSQMSGLV